MTSRSCGTKERQGTEPSDDRFRQNSNGADHGRATEDDTPTKDCSPKNQPHDDREEIIAETLVATRDTGKRRARSEARRLQADECEEDRGVAQALRRA